MQKEMFGGDGAKKHHILLTEVEQLILILLNYLLEHIHYISTLLNFKSFYLIITYELYFDNSFTVNQHSHSILFPLRQKQL